MCMAMILPKKKMCMAMNHEDARTIHIVRMHTHFGLTCLFIFDLRE